VGGGIGGLAAAIAVRQRGHDVVVLERARRIDPLGAGITIFANGMRALARLGVRDAVVERGAPARYSAILTSDGDRLAEVPADLLEGTTALHRGELQAVLTEAAGDVRLGATVTSIEDGSVRMEGGDESADLVVGADGINSVVREAIGDERPTYAGYTAWRGVSPFAVDPGRLTESWGVGERFGLVDIGTGRTYWFATKNAPEGEEDEPGGRKAELMRRFSGWHEPIGDVLDATDDDAILRNDVYYLDPIDRWSDRSVVLLGDAAHATTPGLGQGAAQALEDAVVLADCLDSLDPVEYALATYQARREPRTSLVLKMSRRVDKAAQMSSPLAWRARNALVRGTPASVQRRQLEPIVNFEL